MKANYLYIATAVILIILVFIFWGGEKNREADKEVDNQTVDVSTSTSVSTQNINRPTGTGSVQKPAFSPSKTNTSKPVETSTQEPVPSIPSISNLNGSIFRMTSYNGTAIPADSKYTLSFENGSLSAKFCNSISGNFVLDGSLIKASNLMGTQMYCAIPSNLMEIESDFASMLNFGGTIYQSGNKIILSYSQGIVMVFTGF